MPRYLPPPDEQKRESCTIDLPDAPLQHMYLLGLLEQGVQLFHTGRTEPGKLKLYLMLPASRWKAFLRTVPISVGHSEPFHRYLKAHEQTKPLALKRLTWKWLATLHAATVPEMHEFMEIYSNAVDSLETTRWLRIAAIDGGVRLANTGIWYLPITYSARHTLTQWLRRHKIAYKLVTCAPSYLSIYTVNTDDNEESGESRAQEYSHRTKGGTQTSKSSQGYGAR